MIDRYLLRILFLFATLNVSLSALTGQQMSEREIIEYFENKRIEAGILLKGAAGEIPSLGIQYCSEGGYVDIVPPSWHSLAESIDWTVTTFVASEEGKEHPGWGEYIGTGQSTVFRFYPDRVVDPYFGVRIYFSYIQKNDIGLPVGTTTNDYTFVYETPVAIPFGSDAEICQGESVDLILETSVSGVEYQLQKIGRASCRERV